MLTPSLYTLYKQGRFRATEDGSEEGMKQVERFAVAMLGFVLQHVPEFKKDFLKWVCGRAERGDEDGFEVAVEVPGCGDLALWKPDEAYVFEIKVNAGIQPHNQDPTDRSLFFGEKGYGTGIRKRFKGENTYIVLQHIPADFSNVAEENPKCLSKSWQDVRNCPDRHPLVRDLFHSLASLQIPAFVNMNIKKKPGLNDTILDAVSILSVLDAATAYIGSAKKNFQFHTEPNGKEGCVWRHFRPSSQNLSKWTKLLEPVSPEGDFGHVEYSFYDGRPALGIWFRYGNANALKRIDALLTELCRTRFRGAYVEDYPSPPKENHVRIAFAAEKSADHYEWFKSVFDALVPSK